MIRLFDPVRDNAIPLADLHKLCFPDPWDPQTIARLSGGAGFALIHGRLSHPAGFVLTRTMADEAEILTIATRPENRRAGIARSLLREAACIAETRGAKTLFLEVDAANVAAIALYESAGFSKTGERKGYYKVPGQPASDALVLKAVLPLGLSSD